MVLFAILAALFMIPVIGFVTERRAWNNGICAAYGEPWVHFDNDSQGGRGYKCRDKRIWISYPFIDPRPVRA
jgi:hypothetical protein